MKAKKKSSTPVYVYGIVMIFIQAVTNIENLFWTVWLTLEQIGTGWDGGTRIEMLALLPWMIHLLTLPVIAAAIVYFILHAFKGSDKTILITNIVLLLMLVGQIVLTNLFMFY